MNRFKFPAILVWFCKKNLKNIEWFWQNSNPQSSAHKNGALANWAMRLLYQNWLIWSLNAWFPQRREIQICSFYVEGHLQSKSIKWTHFSGQMANVRKLHICIYLQNKVMIVTSFHLHTWKIETKLANLQCLFQNGLLDPPSKIPTRIGLSVGRIDKWLYKAFKNNLYFAVRED